METIRATVNDRLLTKASRLFTGTLHGRVIEILQNARRAGAIEVQITNGDGVVRVHDNGNGIEDFAKLLDLGSSGWDEAIEASEDPAGVGVFCLSPRQVTIRSNGKQVTIKDDGWTGATVAVLDDPKSIEGSVLQFQDENWDSAAVDLNAVFCGMQVIVDGRECPKLPFVTENAMHYGKLGCRIEVLMSQDLNPWHHSCKRERWMYTNVLVNFHGQVVCLDHHPVSERYMNFLVEMSEEPTGIRMMLPARTCLVENDGLKDLKAALELEAYRFVQRCGKHTLPYKEYLRAKELGIELPEAELAYDVGLLAGGEAPEPVRVKMPKGFPLEQCYRFDLDSKHAKDTDEANIHLLAALGVFEEPFVPVSILQHYDGYSWANLPLMEQVELSVGKKLHRECIWGGTLTCVKSLRISVQTSDGRTFSSLVCMAVSPAQPSGAAAWANDHVLVTSEAQERLSAEEIWYHLGGMSEEGDTYDTQAQQFEEELQGFWARLHGPDEQLRRNLLAALDGVQKTWRFVTISRDGIVTLQYADGSRKTIAPPGHSKQ